MLKSVFLIVPLLTMIASPAVQAQSIPNLSVSDRARLSRDLTLTNSQDFFKQGRDQLEREIRLLEQRSTSQKENPLRIDLKQKPSATRSESTFGELSQYSQTQSPHRRVDAGY